MTQVEVAVAQHAELFSRFAAVSENLTTALSGISQRLDRIEARFGDMETRFEVRFESIEARLTNIETDLAIVKEWVDPRSEDSSEA